MLYEGLGEKLILIEEPTDEERKGIEEPVDGQREILVEGAGRNCSSHPSIEQQRGFVDPSSDGLQDQAQGLKRQRTD